MDCLLDFNVIGFWLFSLIFALVPFYQLNSTSTTELRFIPTPSLYRIESLRIG